ncbi:MAG: 30S ribosome-binding factor RbfA [Firmicutes bacterium]|nr:30S ribosome-binding factor RbfA [Bacillota bacterium]
MGKGYRQGRMSGEIQKIISHMLLRELKDPRLDGMVSITAVDVTSDGSYATVYVTVFEPGLDDEKLAERQDEVIEALGRAKGLMRKEIGRSMKLRHTPELIFKIDRSMEYGRHMDEVIRNVMKEQENSGNGEQDEE